MFEKEFGGGDNVRYLDTEAKESERKASRSLPVRTRRVQNPQGHNIIYYMSVVRGAGYLKMLALGILGLHLGCMCPFHLNEHYTDQAFGNVILRKWEWQQSAIISPCANPGNVSYSDLELLDRNESRLVNHVKWILVQGEKPAWGVATVSVSGERDELQPYVEVLDLEKGAIRASLRLPAGVKSNFKPEFDPTGQHLLLGCDENRSTASLYMVTWGREPSLQCLYREEGKLVLSKANYRPNTNVPVPVASPLWSPDGQSVAFIVRVGIYRWTQERGWQYPSTELVHIRIDEGVPRVVQVSDAEPSYFVIHWNQNDPELIVNR
jgi:hypothetical protein